MKRCLGMLLIVCTGCGSSDPVGVVEPTPYPSGTMLSVTASDLNTYLVNVARSYETVNVMNAEFGSITQGWRGGVVSTYWTRQFMSNLIVRIEELQERVKGIRPDDAELRRIHASYEQGLATFHEAFIAFVGQIDFPTPEGIEGVNLLIFRGNKRIDEFQLMLSNLAGRQIQF
ncbi:MAG: hypothetical protein J4F39_05515 [Candidatus Latescibacteria bacterium]|nr:hypothetical protein [Candidatus Latescibacterota bacterium]